MSEAKHTPGPWLQDGELVRESDGKLVADCSIFFPKTNRQSENEANARLIAAAPALLHVAKVAINLGSIAIEDSAGYRACIQELCELGGAAIAKAEGRS